ncbi:MAG TPA: Yip1 family protein [Candidatus Baltobacteraceae bacterium]|nr:Yip1 family protein [Candidatus Baltobacteraceae bacterium]
MPLVDRAWKIVAFPTREWPLIARETIPIRTLYLGYALPLATIGPACGLLRISYLGFPIGKTVYRVPLVTGIVQAVASLVFLLLAAYVLGLLVDALTQTFGGEPDSEQAQQVVVYSYTPAWLAGILVFLPPGPLLGIAAIAIQLYCAYLLYLGLTPMLKVPRDNAAGFTVLVAIGAVLLAVLFDFGINALRLSLGLRS